MRRVKKRPLRPHRDDRELPEEDPGPDAGTRWRLQAGHDREGPGRQGQGHAGCVGAPQRVDEQADRRPPIQRGGPGVAPKRARLPHAAN
eukprot:15685737-Heterocapsa_arctica.AAC.1